MNRHTNDRPRLKYRESSVGCGVLAGVVLGLLVGMAVTITWFKPGTWGEWAAAIGSVAFCALACGIGVRTWGDRAWVAIYYLFRWFQ